MYNICDCTAKQCGCHVAGCNCSGLRSHSRAHDRKDPVAGVCMAVAVEVAATLGSWSRTKRHNAQLMMKPSSNITNVMLARRLVASFSVFVKLVFALDAQSSEPMERGGVYRRSRHSERSSCDAKRYSCCQCVAVAIAPEEHCLQE